MPDQRPIRVFVVDDHEMVRLGLSSLFDAEDGFEVVGEAATAAAALGRVRATRPDVLLLDVRLGDESGIEVCREVRSAVPSVAVLMITSFSDERAEVDAALADVELLPPVEPGKILCAGVNFPTHREETGQAP